MSTERFIFIVPGIRSPGVKGLDGIGEEVDEDSGELRLRSPDHGPLQPVVLEPDVIPVVEHRYLVRGQGIEVDVHHLLGIELGEGGEFIGSVRQHIDAVQNHPGCILEPQLKLRVIVPLHPDKPLNLKFHRRQRVLYLVRHLAGHLAPRPLPFRLGHLLSGLIKVVHHQVVGPYEA